MNGKVRPTIFNGFIIIATIIALIAIAALILTSQENKEAASSLLQISNFKKIASPTMPNSTSQFLTYSNEKFTIQYPAGYRIDEVENNSVKLRIYAVESGKLAQVIEVTEYDYTPSEAAKEATQLTKTEKEIFQKPTQTQKQNFAGKKYTLITTTTTQVNEEQVTQEPLLLNWAFYQCKETTLAVQTAIPQSQTKDAALTQFIINSFNC